MPTALTCPSCNHANLADARFCTACGGSLEARQTCPSCRKEQPLNNRFCLVCGGELGASAWNAPPANGSVDEGVWNRAPDEFLRRVEPEECRSFLGSRSVLVPAGTVGLVVVDGVVERVLPPGERTTTTALERVANFFTGRGRSTALFLLDSRPVPVPFTVETRPNAQGQSFRSQVLVTAHVPRGDKDSLGAFLTHVVGDRSGVAAADLFDLLRPEVVRQATLTLERLASAGDLGWTDAEAALQDAIGALAKDRFGLRVTVALAPMAATMSFDLHLGTVASPRVRACSGCEHELPVSLLFCDQCGARQEALILPERHCAQCGADVPHDSRFCNGCGTAWHGPAAGDLPLFSRDGEQLELDVVLRARGILSSPASGAASATAQAGDLSARLAAAVAGLVARHLRAVDFPVLATASGLAGIEGALEASLPGALMPMGLSLDDVTVLDLRTRRGDWLLGARADLTRARDDLLLGREWLTQRTGELDLRGLAFDVSLREQVVERDARLASKAAELAGETAEQALEREAQLERDRAAIADREAREALADQDARLRAAAAERGATVELTVLDAEERLAAARRANVRTADGEQLDHGISLAAKRAAHAAELARQAAAFQSETSRLGADDGAYASRSRALADHEAAERKAILAAEMADRDEARALEKLRGMTELDLQLEAAEAAREQARIAALRGLSPAEALAAQAATLAGAPAGAAFAEALARLGEAQAAQARVADAERHAAALSVAQGEHMDRLTRLAEQALGRGSGADAAYAQSLSAVTRVATARVTPAAVVAAVTVPSVADGAPCKACSAALRASAAFCGACGSPVG